MHAIPHRAAHRILAITLVLLWQAANFATAQVPSGTWKLMQKAPQQAICPWVIEISEKGGKPAVMIVDSAPPVRNSRIDQVESDGKVLKFHLEGGPMRVEFRFPIPKGESPGKILGIMEANGRREFAQLEKTDQKKLNQRDIVTPDPNLAEAGRVMGIRDMNERQKAMQSFLATASDSPLTYLLGHELLAMQAAHGSSPAELKPQADKLVTMATAYGDEMKPEALHQIASILLRSDKQPALALEYSEAASKALPESASPQIQASLLKTWRSALVKNGKTAEAAKLSERVAALDRKLDEEFAKNAVPFLIEKPTPRSGKSNRVAVLELFTGAQCPPCVAADVAFDALLKTYTTKDVVLLQYHLHIPGPDPLTNADSEKRAEFYGVQGTPAAYLNGKEGPPIGGFREHAKEHYDTLMRFLGEGIELTPQAQLTLNAERKGDAIQVQADVKDLKKPGDSTRLRFVLVEDLVRYPGRNGQRLHHHVVRALPGGAEGIALKTPAAKQELTLKIPELRTKLQDYLAEHNKKQKFLDDDRPLDLKNLKLIAIIQDTETKQIYQAVQVDLPGA